MESQNNLEPGETNHHPWKRARAINILSDSQSLHQCSGRGKTNQLKTQTNMFLSAILSKICHSTLWKHSQETQKRKTFSSII